MSSFTDDLLFVSIGNGLYKTNKSFRFYYEDEMIGSFVEVPVDFISNGASIPKFIQKIFGWNPVDIRWAQASFLHDGMVGETGTRLKIFDDFGNSYYPDWNESCRWFDKALSVKRANSKQCPHLNRKLFVSAVRMWGKFRKQKKPD